MRRTFPAALLTAVCAAVVFVPSAMAKKVPPPPPAPTGTFTLSPGATISFANMTLDSGDTVSAGYCVSLFEDVMACEEFGNNNGGTAVSLDDVSYTNTSPFTLTVQLALIDGTAGWIYFADGMMQSVIGGSEPQPGNHARLGWSADATQVLVSINDGSQNTTTDWQPALGEGNFNAAVQVTPPAPTGWTITQIDGYSDDAVLDETTETYSCSFHTVITYTSKGAKKTKKLNGEGAYVYLIKTNPLALGGMTNGALAASPFDTSSLGWLPNEELIAGDYAFTVVITDSNENMLASQTTSTFPLNDPATYTDNHGCPPTGLLVSTSFGG